MPKILIVGFYFVLKLLPICRFAHKTFTVGTVSTLSKIFRTASSDPVLVSKADMPPLCNYTLFTLDSG